MEEIILTFGWTYSSQGCLVGSCCSGTADLMSIWFHANFKSVVCRTDGWGAIKTTENNQTWSAQGVVQEIGLGMNFDFRKRHQKIQKLRILGLNLYNCLNQTQESNKQFWTWILTVTYPQWSMCFKWCCDMSGSGGFVEEGEIYQAIRVRNRRSHDFHDLGKTHLSKDPKILNFLHSLLDHFLEKQRYTTKHAGFPFPKVSWTWLSHQKQCSNTCGATSNCNFSTSGTSCNESNSSIVGRLASGMAFTWQEYAKTLVVIGALGIHPVPPVAGLVKSVLPRPKSCFGRIKHHNTDGVCMFLLYSLKLKHTKQNMVTKSWYLWRMTLDCPVLVKVFFKKRSAQRGVSRESKGFCVYKQITFLFQFWLPLFFHNLL